MPNKRGGEAQRWDGGYWRRNADGKKVFVIYRKVRGTLYEISTRCTHSGAAHEHLKRFEADPEAYKACPIPDSPNGLFLDEDLASKFLEWSRDEKKNSVKHRLDQRRALTWWQERVGNVDLRKLSTARLHAELDKVKRGKRQLITTFKAFYGWLRKERHAVATGEDPTFGQLRAPQAKVAQLKTDKTVTRDQYLTALSKLEGWPRDALMVLGATGWHVSELERFASGGDVEQHPLTGAPVLLCPRTKGGNHLRTEVSAETADAAKRLRERGTVDYFDLRRAIESTGAKFNPGYLRHAVASWAINSGADPSVVSAFLNHRSLVTTRKFYATHAVPAKVPTLADEPKGEQ